MKPILSILIAYHLATLAAAAEFKPILLVDLAPAKTEYGMLENPWGLRTGPGVIDMGSWGQWQSGYWPESKKAVIGYPADFRLPPGQAYSSASTNLFAVQGDLVTGVGLWAKINCMYHWLEYAVPTGAAKFTAKLFTTDDVRGANFHVSAENPPNQDFDIVITVDGARVHERHVNRMKVPPGSGKLIDTVSLALPAGAKTIRFYLASTSFDSNINNEVVISAGRFE